MYPPHLKTNRFTLLPYRQKDEDRFVVMGLDPAVLQFMGGGADTADEAGERKFFQKIFTIYDDTESKRWFWIWGIYENDLLCGHFELKETQYTSEQELEIVYMTHPAARRKGLMREVLAFFKSNQKVWGKTIIATVSQQNSISIQLLEEWGITKKQLIDPKDGEESFWKFTLDANE